MCSLEQQELGSGMPLLLDMAFAWWFLLSHAATVLTWLESLFPWVRSWKPESCLFPHHCVSIHCVMGIHVSRGWHHCPNADSMTCWTIAPYAWLQKLWPHQQKIHMKAFSQNWLGIAHEDLYKHRQTQRLGELLVQGRVMLKSWLYATLCL